MLSRPLLALVVVLASQAVSTASAIWLASAAPVGDSGVGILAQLGRYAGDASRLGRGDHDLTGRAIGGADRVEFVVPGHGGIADP